jgi:hypothetical protein
MLLLWPGWQTNIHVTETDFTIESTSPAWARLNQLSVQAFYTEAEQAHPQ